MTKRVTLKKVPKSQLAARAARKAETAARRAERVATMRRKGFVLVDEAAAMAKVPRSNVYHWTMTGEIAKLKWGSGPGSLFVSVSDLRIKAPEAFEGRA